MTLVVINIILKYTAAFFMGLGGQLPFYRSSFEEDALMRKELRLLDSTELRRPVVVQSCQENYPNKTALTKKKHKIWS